MENASFHIRHDKRRKNFVGTIMKMTELLHLITQENAPLGVSELARRARLPKSTTFRIIRTLTELQLVERQTGGYQLGPGLRSLAHRSAPRFHLLNDLCIPFLAELYEETHETVSLVVLDDTEVVYPHRVYGHNRVRTPSHGTGSAPAYCTAGGKVLLAYSVGAAERVLAARLPARTSATITQSALLRAELRRIRRHGLAFDRQEFAPGVHCVAVPILLDEQTPLAAISVAGPVGRLLPPRVSGSLRRTTHRISQAARVALPTVLPRPWDAAGGN